MASSQRGVRALGCLVVLALAVGAGLGAAYLMGRESGNIAPSALEDRCILTAAGDSVTLDPEQAHYASIIVGTAVRRGLPARAGSIAMATVYQESGIRNLDYGDRDSLGLFQQRPSQGWGSPSEVRDPWYATDAFYDALVEIDGWQTGDINDVAQAVQRSGYPEAYRQHEPNARIIASVLAGRSPQGITCAVRDDAPGDPEGLAASIEKTLGIAVDPGSAIAADPGDDNTRWALAHHAVANAGRYGVSAVQVGDRRWTRSDGSAPAWQPSEEPTDGVVISFR
ncbi:hypothetical protein [Naumannella huperziae]